MKLLLIFIASDTSSCLSFHKNLKRCNYKNNHNTKKRLSGMMLNSIKFSSFSTVERMEAITFYTFNSKDLQRLDTFAMLVKKNLKRGAYSPGQLSRNFIKHSPTKGFQEVVVVFS